MMLYRMYPMAMLALALFVGASALADKALDQRTSTHEGKFVSTSGDQFVMTDKRGGEHAHTLAADAKITCDGKVCKAARLTPDMRIRVTTKPVAQEAVTGIEALEKQKEFESMHEGTVVSIAGKKLVMTGKDGTEHAHTLAAGAAVCCDGKACKAAELKTRMKIRVTTKRGDESVATRIEALGKHNRFADIQEGSLARIGGEELVLTTSKDGKEQAHTLAADAAVTCDGKICKVADLKPEARVRVTISERIDDVVIRVEALDKQNAFAQLD